jgi:choline dehydrogenase
MSALRLPAGLKLLRRLLPPPTRPLASQYDYVIVGAGSAGCVLANELTQDASASVLLIEAGGWDTNPLIHIPAGVYSVFKDPSVNWNWESEPEAGCGGRKIELPRGKVVGGSSSINAMVYMRGHPLDYDGWADADASLEPWRFERVLPYFKACERSDRGASAYRGGSGRLEVTRGATENALYDAFLAAGDEAGQGTSDDLNGFKPEGVARLDRTVSRDGRRASAATAHLEPALARENLQLLRNAAVEKVEIDGRRATGVRLNGGELVSARREVLLCAGAIKTPQLLMLSGIGDKGQLDSIGVDVVADLQGVGQNLMDHACVNVAAGCRTSDAIDGLARPLQKAAVGARWLVDGKGWAASNAWEAGGLVFGSDAYAYPNLQYHFCPVHADYRAGGGLTLRPGFQIQVDQLRPYSRGRVAISSRDPAADPSVRFNYLSDPRDVVELVEGVRRALDIVYAPAFDPFRADLRLPDTRNASDDDLEAFVRATCGTDYHPSGTAKMGSGSDAVVDADLRVHGVDGLRVVDASVLPSIVSGNLNAPVQMIARKAADVIRGVEGLPSERPEYHFDADEDVAVAA